MTTQIIIGLGFGDEGKGLFTDYLCRQLPNHKTLVVRFSGGHQAGHTVVDAHNNNRHVFSHFGAGSFCGVPTYWSQFCTYNPAALLQEYTALQCLGISPTIFVDNLCPLTTPYDILYNRLLEKMRNKAAHGSCGVGIGTTIQRHEDYYKLFAQDAKYEGIVRTKLHNIYQYYAHKVAQLPDAQQQEFNDFDPQTIANYFVEQLQAANKIVQLVSEKAFFTQNRFDNYVFEGSQGVLLDMDFGFFPNVTRSNTTTKNALHLIKTYQLAEPQINYISRAYQTRHGNGFMTNNHLTLHLPQPNPHETNVYNQFQGNFKQTVLDVDLLNYALTADNNFSAGLPKNLVLTCLDQTGNDLCFTQNNKVKHINYQQLHTQLSLSFAKRFYSFGDTALHINT